MFRLEPAEAHMAKPWHQMQAHELRVAVMRLGAKRRFHTHDPALEELLERLALVAERRRPLLHRA